MRPKISFDKKAIGRFFLQHAEKLLLGAFALVFAVIIYGALLRREKFDKTPSDLADNITKAKRSLAGDRKEKLTELEKDLKARDDKGDYKKAAERIAASSKQGVSVEPYQYDVALDKPLFGQRDKRGQPEIFDVQDVRAAADFGAFQVAEPGAAGPAAPAGPPRGSRIIQPRTSGGASVNVKGKHWVVVTGLVPLEKQANAYRTALMESVAYDPANDVPTYAYYTIERAEINSPADEKNPNWKQFNSADVQKDIEKDWPQEQADVVDAKYIDPNLTFPLGPLQNRAWGKNVAHDPEIPLLNAEGAAGGAPEGERGARGGQYNRGVQAVSTESAEYKLLRFFDFSVVPGKSYIYRVSLALKNPNFGFDAAKLQTPELAKENYLYTNLPTGDKPAGQTNLVDVPKDTQILIGAAKSEEVSPGKFPVVLLTWAPKNGRSGYLSVSNVDHGQVLNIISGTAIPVAGDSPATSSSDSDDPKTDFITDTTLLDMDGGKKFTVGKDHKSTVPREMLFMAVNGKSFMLKLRDELEDMSEVNRITTKPETPAGTERRGPGGIRGTDPRSLIRGGGGGYADKGNETRGRLLPTGHRLANTVAPGFRGAVTICSSPKWC